jgi:hypothetical protein
MHDAFGKGAPQRTKMARPESRGRDEVELRESLESLMQSQNLTPSAWSKRAGVPESALRNFLKGRSHTLTHSTLKALASVVHVPVTRLIRQEELWQATETVNVETAINFTQRPGDTVSISDVETFSVRIPKHSKYPNLPKIGAYVEDSSADKICPAQSVLIFADFEWMTSGLEENEMAIKPNDLLVILEKIFKIDADINTRAPFVRSSVRKIMNDDGIDYLVTCTTRPRYMASLRLPSPIIGRSVRPTPLLTGADSEIIVLGKVLTSIAATSEEERDDR